jgi:flagellar basal body rod protein FlgC
MIETMHGAMAGLRASVARLNVAGANIANARTTGLAGDPDGYVPKAVVKTTDVAGHPRAVVLPVVAPAASAYLPNVSLPEQFVELSIARRSYEANLAVLEITNEMMRFLVDREA